ncbi:MAG: hypothetical protein KDE19_03990 [Caldilineaceae bacterium]|nr:hypothetical protein [Caldilineaceae bacterium]
MAQHDTPRFEFRVFGIPLNETLEGIIQKTPVTHTEQQRDLYLLATGVNRYNIKIRQNTLNTKVLMRRQEGLERWHPHLDIAFPLSAAFLHEILFPLLQLQSAALKRDLYTIELLQTEVIQSQPTLRIIPVHKQRRHYAIDNCQLEVAVLYVDDRFYTHTIAIEAVDPAAVQQLRAQLGLSGVENVNYNRGLKDLLASDTTAPYTFSFAERVGLTPIAV